jgi:hypothetical protein
LSNIHFVGGEKGGVGKSVFARLLAQYHIDRELPFCAFDSDRSHAALLRFYGDYTVPVALDAFESADLIVETALEQPRDVIVDLAAQTATPLFQWIDDNDLMSLAAEEGIGLVFWHMMDDGADSIALLRGMLERRDAREHLVAVRNFGRGGNFERFDSSSERADAEQAGVLLMDLPALHQTTMRKVDHQAASFWAAANNRDEMGLMDRQRVKVWLRKAYAPLDQMADRLFVARALENAGMQGSTPTLEPAF